MKIYRAWAKTSQWEELILGYFSSKESAMNAIKYKEEIASKGVLAHGIEEIEIIE